METWQQQSFDAIIIGSGPGGATVANELSKRGKRSLILEWGNASPIKGTISQSAGMVLIPGQSLLFTSQFHTLVRGITLGGSSIFAYASAFEPPGVLAPPLFCAHQASITQVSNSSSTL